MATVLGIFRDGFEELVFFEQHPSGAHGVEGLELLAPEVAAQRVSEIPLSEVGELREVLIRHGEVAPPEDDAELLEALVDLVEAQRLIVGRRRSTTTAFDLIDIDSDTTALADEAGPLPAPAPAPRPTFAVFRLVDDGGNPIVERAFTLDLPDGRTVDGVTGPDGRFEVDPVDSPGNCVLRFAEA